MLYIKSWNILLDRIVAGAIVKMSSNSVVKKSIVIGGLTFLGYVTGGKLGSMLGNLPLFHFFCLKMFKNKFE